MNSKQPELTIFQGAPSIYIDNNHMRVEEEEAIQDRKRLNAELKIELEKEFGNLSDDEDDPNETMNSTKYSHHQNHSNGNNNMNGFSKDFPLRDDFASLKNLVETKSREIEEFSNLLNFERKQNAAMVDEYEKRLKIADAEKERALMNRDQTHELLVENKGKVIEINDKNQELMSKIKALERENEKLVNENESTKLMLSDVQTKYNMVEKNVIFNAERNTDSILKQQQERHNAKIVMMQQQIESLKKKYDDLEHEYKHLDIRYKELQRSRESMLIEKSEMINQLNRNLEESQRQCQDLLARSDYTQENMRLQNAVRVMEHQKQELSNTINKLQKKIQEQTSEMEMMDSIINEHDENNQSISDLSKFVRRDPLKNVNSTPLSSEDRLSKLKEELSRSLQSIKMKREEIKILEKQISEKDNEISELKRDESKLLIDLNKYRDDNLKLENKISLLQQELDIAKNDIRKYNTVLSHNTSCNKENEELISKELNEKKQECEELYYKIETLTIDNDKISQKLKTKHEDLEKLTNNLNQMQQKQKSKLDKSIQKNIESNEPCEKCNEYQLKIQKLESSCSELQNINENYIADLNNLKQQLDNALFNIENLEEKLNLQNSRDQEIDKLKEKAKEFENFMRTNAKQDCVTKSLSQNSSASPFDTKIDASTDTSEIDKNLVEKENNFETKIRDEMARIFAKQIKNLEKQFIEEAKKLQHENIFLISELESKSTNLHIYTEQVDLLKFTIVHEREEFQSILQQKDNEIIKCQNHIAHLNDKIELIDEERISIENLKRQIEQERTILCKKEEETLAKLKKLQQESTRIIEELNEKYKSAKKTAMNYKQYSEDKEKHYRSECERIKNGYAEAVEKIQNRLKETIQQKEEGYQEKLKKIKQEYEFKIDVLKGMIEKSNFAQKQ